MTRTVSAHEQAAHFGQVPEARAEIRGEDGAFGGDGSRCDHEIVRPALRPAALDMRKESPMCFSCLHVVRLDRQRFENLEEELAARRTMPLGGSGSV